MGSARQLLALALAALLVSFAAALASGCGSSEQPTRSAAGEPAAPAPVGSRARSCTGAVAGVGRVRAVGVGCTVGHRVVGAWSRKQTCAAPPGSSRSSCAIDSYRCQAVATQGGLAVDCAKPGRSISFRVEKR